MQTEQAAARPLGDEAWSSHMINQLVACHAACGAISDECGGTLLQVALLGRLAGLWAQHARMSSLQPAGQ